MIGAPIFGYLVDRYARRSLFMMFGSLLNVPVYLMLGYTSIPPVIPMAMMPMTETWSRINSPLSTDRNRGSTMEK